MIVEWDEYGMNLRIKGFALVQENHIILHHSSAPHHFWMTELLGIKWKWQEWLLNDIFSLWFSFFVILDILKWLRNGGMRTNGGVFRRKIKTKFRDTSHSDIIWSFQFDWWQCKASKDGMKFEWWNYIEMMECHLNYGNISKWASSDLFWHRGYYYPDPLSAMPKCQYASRRIEG